MQNCAIWFVVSVLVFALSPPAAAQKKESRTDKEGGELLYNGIRLPEVWPPRKIPSTREPIPIPYLKTPPKIIPIDVGRQLFVDDFLIEQTTLRRTFHAGKYHAANPILRPDQLWEKRLPENEKDKHGEPWAATVFGDGVWYDPADKLFKMFYMGGFVYSTCLATSQDGIHWKKPELNVVEPGTNIVIRHRRDSTSVWLDHDAADPARRYKNFASEWYPGRDHRVHLRFSADGITWSEPVFISQVVGDRTSALYNPFRKVWVWNLRSYWAPNRARSRAYEENPDPIALLQSKGSGVAWLRSDRLDPALVQGGSQISEDISAQVKGPDVELYSFEAVAYESLMLGSFSHIRGVKPDGTKSYDVSLGFSRDGFHFDRPNRSPFLPNSERDNDWNWGLQASAGGVCLVVGDKLHFYSCGRAPTPGGIAGVERGARIYRTGLATLRRDGFASMDAGRWTTPGGDIAATPLSSSPAFSSGSTHVFSSTTDFVAAAQSALDGDGTLQLLLSSATESADPSANEILARFRSNDAGTPSERPLLIIDATVPEPSNAQAQTLFSFQGGVSPTDAYTQAANGLAALDNSPGGFADGETDAQFRIGYAGGVGPMRAVLRYDLSAIPAGSTVNSVSLTTTSYAVFISGTSRTELGPLELREITGADFVESEVSWGNRSVGVPWNTPGGDTAQDAGTLTTRPVRFSGKYLFVNLRTDQGALMVEVLDESGQVIEPFTKSNCVPLSTDKTLAAVKWKDAEDLSALAGKPVRFRFHLRLGALYSFWVSPDASGASHGYVAAGGPGFSGSADTAGIDAYQAADALPPN